MPRLYHTGQLANIACVWEATARKPGNVHPGASFSDLTYLDFVLSATAIGESIRLGLRSSVGQAVWGSTFQTHHTVGKNTNLGIILLLAPLASVSELLRLSNGLQLVLNHLTVDDTKAAYEAIRLAKPGGLGDAPEQDVRSEPTVTLLEAMRLAADRDLIARQYANNYADVFDLGVPAFTDAFAKYGSVEAAVIACQLAWMAAFPDSLIARKRGLEVAEDVQRRVQHVLSLGGLDTPEGRRAGVELDAHLRSDGNKLNPGTTADLVAACLFVALRENKVTPSAPFRWNVPDWL
jgi:triphosphoribosyl-dephospho-CoA synthase